MNFWTKYSHKKQAIKCVLISLYMTKNENQYIENINSELSCLTNQMRLPLMSRYWMQKKQAKWVRSSLMWEIRIPMRALNSTTADLKYHLNLLWCSFNSWTRIWKLIVVSVPTSVPKPFSFLRACLWILSSSLLDDPIIHAGRYWLSRCETSIKTSTK